MCSLNKIFNSITNSSTRYERQNLTKGFLELNFTNFMPNYKNNIKKLQTYRCKYILT